MVGLLIHSIALHNVPLHEATGQDPSGLRGRQETLPPGDGPPSFSMPSSGLLTPLPNPELWCRHLRTYRPHDKEAFRLLAQGPEMDNQLPLVHTHRHPGRRGLPPTPGPSPHIQNRLACLRVLCSPPEINPASARLLQSVQTPSLHRQVPDYRVLSERNAGSRLPLLWLQPRPPSKNRAHLPLDALPHSMLFLLGPDGHSPLPVTSQHLLGEIYPDPLPGRSHPQLQLICKTLLMKEWVEAAPDQSRYPYAPSLKPQPFMGLNKFDTGRLHQMRSGKSYLRAHRSWDDDLPTTCSGCDEAPEPFEHAIIHCHAKRPARSRHLQGVSDIGPEAPVWSSAPLLSGLTRYIKATVTAFPPGMLSRPTSSADSVSSLSSNVVSFGYFMSLQES